MTIPYHTCVTYVQQCIAANSGNNLEQAACAEDNHCGAKDPKKTNVTTTSTTKTSSTASPSSSSTGTGIYDGLAGGTTDSADSSDNKKSAAPRMLESFGATLLFGSLFAGFALMLQASMLFDICCRTCRTCVELLGEVKCEGEREPVSQKTRRMLGLVIMTSPIRRCCMDGSRYPAF